MSEPPLRGNFDPTRPMPMPWHQYFDWLMPHWLSTLNSATEEGTVQHFLEQHPCLLPGGLPQDGLGHHGAWYDAVITQPALVSSRNRRVPDFMWLRRDTSANRPVCIEIERPGKSWYTGGGQPTAQLTQALDQIDDWRVWFNTSTNKQQFIDAYVPAQFRHRSLEPRFILIYGRDAEFRTGISRHRDPEWLRSKRNSLHREDLTVMTFDMLRASQDLKDHVCLAGHLPQFEVRAIPPTFGTGTSTPEELLIHTSDPALALSQCGQMSQERRDYVAGRWDYWRRRATEPAQRRQPSLTTE